MKNIVEKLTEKMKEKFYSYTLGLILEKGKKSCVQISKIFGETHDFIYQIFRKYDFVTNEIPNFAILFANFCSKQEEGWLIIDDTVISKVFSRVIVGVHDLYNSAMSRPDRGLCIVVLAWSNGLVTIPLKFKWMFSKEIAQDFYKSKSELAQELILECCKKVQFKYLLADGHFSTKTQLLPFLYKNKIDFLMKVSKSKVIETKNGIRSQIKNHPALKLYKNNRSAMVIAYLGDMLLIFAVQKRKAKNGEYKLIYFVSNMSLRSKEYVKVYKGRWHIEVMFRTFKQSLGLQDCMAQSLEKQATHIYFVFFSYSFLQNEKIKKKFDNPEDSIRMLSELKLTRSITLIRSFYRNFQCIA